MNNPQKHFRFFVSVLLIAIFSYIFFIVLRQLVDIRIAAFMTGLVGYILMVSTYKLFNKEKYFKN